MLMAELLVRSATAAGERLRRVLAEVVPVLAVAGILVLIGALSSSILPPWEWLALILLGAAGVTALLWRRFVRLHTRLQVALMETLQAHKPH